MSWDFNMLFSVTSRNAFLAYDCIEWKQMLSPCNIAREHYKRGEVSTTLLMYEISVLFVTCLRKKCGSLTR